MLGATIRESQINSSSVLRLHNDSKRLSISVHCYGLRRSRNQLRSLNRCDKSILGAWAYPQRSFGVIGVCCQEENRIQPFAAGIALVWHFLSSKFSHLSNYPLVQVIARSIGRDLSKNLCFAAKPGITAFSNALSDKEVNYGESHSGSERERQSCPNRNPPRGGSA